MGSQWTKIRPRVGLGELRFGQSQRLVRSEIGAPSDIDRSIPGHETWKYDIRSLEVSFDEDADWRLIDLAIDHPMYTLSGRTLVGLSVADVEHIAPDLGIGAVHRDDRSIQGDSIFEFPEHDVQILCLDGVAEVVRWSVHIDDDDQYRWPLESRR